MIVRRAVFAVAALAATAAAAGVLVVSGSFAIYMLLRQFLTPAGAGAVVALAAAIVCALGGLFFASQLKLPTFRRRVVASGAPPPRLSLVDQVVEVVRERPFVAAGAAAAAGLLAFTNPALVTAVMRAFIAPRPPRQ